MTSKSHQFTANELKCVQSNSRCLWNGKCSPALKVNWSLSSPYAAHQNKMIWSFRLMMTGGLYYSYSNMYIFINLKKIIFYYYLHLTIQNILIKCNFVKSFLKPMCLLIFREHHNWTTKRLNLCKSNVRLENSQLTVLKRNNPAV